MEEAHSRPLPSPGRNSCLSLPSGRSRRKGFLPLPAPQDGEGGGSFLVLSLMKEEKGGGSFSAVFLQREEGKEEAHSRPLPP